MCNSRITDEFYIPTHFYDEKSDDCSENMISYAFNDSYTLEIQVRYSKILLIRNHLCECEMWPLL